MLAAMELEMPDTTARRLARAARGLRIPSRIRGATGEW
jgi:hypothetical protein